MRLYFIRHGKPKIIANEFYKCHLSEEGVFKTKELAESSIIPKPDFILSSPFNRAIDTAKIFADTFNKKIEIREFLREWNLQTLNLSDEDYFIEEKKGYENQNQKVKGNESLNQIKERALKGVLEVVKTYPNSKIILLVSHGTFINMICSEILGRRALLSDIKGINYLGYAIIEYNNKKINVLKDILD